MKHGAYWHRAKCYCDFDDFINRNDDFLYFLRCGICKYHLYLTPSVDAPKKCPRCGTEMTEGVKDDPIPYYIGGADDE